MRNKLMLMFAMILLVGSLAEAKVYRGIDDNGYPFIVELEEISKIEEILRKLFVMFGVVRPNPVMPGDSFQATFYLHVDCPSGCRPEYLGYSWHYGTGSVGVSDVSCGQTYMSTVTQFVPDDAIEGQYTIFGWLSGSLNCRASSTDQVDFVVGENPPDCTGKPCSDWSACIQGYKTRVCYYDDCSTWVETKPCSVTTVPGPTTIGTTTIDGNGDDGGVNIIIILGAVIGLGMLYYGVKK